MLNCGNIFSRSQHFLESVKVTFKDWKLEILEPLCILGPAR